MLNQRKWWVSQEGVGSIHLKKAAMLQLWPKYIENNREKSRGKIKNFKIKMLVHI